MSGGGVRWTEEALADFQRRQGAATQRDNRLVCAGGGLLEVPTPVPELPRSAKKPEHGEDAKQKALIEWAAHVSIGTWRLSELLVAVPNGGYRTAFEAVNMKLMGVQAGYPDLQLPVPAGRYHGAMWEMKHGRNRPTALQIEWHEKLRELGYYVNVCWQTEEAAEDIVRYLRLQKHWTIVVRAKL